jgi:membrane associated rhomboid family serine protease
MIIPYNTDAPIYHFPFVTIGLIAVNVLVFFTTSQMDEEQIIPWLLIFGDGLHPLQWISTHFLHADFMHLLGNMFYLWGFGLVVEGKLGWWRMLVVYLAIGLIYGLILQVAMLGSEGGALGASGVIFGLLAISLVWAPKNEMSCFMWVVRPILFDVSIIVFATSYIVWQFFVAWWSGFGMSSEMLHLTGAGIGAVFGVALLKLDVVDCEGWDLFAVWQGNEGGRNTERVRRVEEEPPPERKPLRAMQSRNYALEIENKLLTGDPTGAAEAYLFNRKVHPEWMLDEPALMGLIRALHEQKLWSASIPIMVDYLRQFPESSVRMRLKLAQILIAAEQRPVKAIAVLSKLDSHALPADLKQMKDKLLARANAMQADGDLEIADSEDW